MHSGGDEGGAWRRFVAVGTDRLGYHRAVERVVEGVDGVALEAEADMGVDGGSGAGGESE